MVSEGVWLHLLAMRVPIQPRPGVGTALPVRMMRVGVTELMSLLQLLQKIVQHIHAARNGGVIGMHSSREELTTALVCEDSHQWFQLNILTKFATTERIRNTNSEGRLRPNL